MTRSAAAKTITDPNGECLVNTAKLLWGVLFSSIGLGYFLYGRKQKSPVPFLCGIALMGYTYFLDSNLAIVGVGSLLVAIPYFVRL